MPNISPDLIAQFNRAAGLARLGRYEDALTAWDALLEPAHRPEENRIATGHFLGVAHMRRAWVLMDLGRYAEARARMEEPVMRALITQFEPQDLFEYYYSYGNILGNLGDIEAMDHAFTRALNLAATELGDLPRCLRTWHFLISHALVAGAWAYLLEEAPRALLFGRNMGAQDLVVTAERALTAARSARPDLAELLAAGRLDA